MTVKEMIELLSKQNPDAEVTFTKKTFYPSSSWWESGSYDYDTFSIEECEFRTNENWVDFCR